MAFKYRKCDPGSGGARPGAGRRPDITPEERLAIGHLCTLYYVQRSERHNRLMWFEKLIGDLDDLLDATGAADVLREKIFNRYILGPYEEHFIARVLAGPHLLYDHEDNLSFDLESHLPLFNAIAEASFGSKRQFRSGQRMPRALIAAAKREIIGQVRLKFAVGGDSEIGPIQRRLELTDGFVASCWQAYVR